MGSGSCCAGSPPNELETCQMEGRADPSEQSEAGKEEGIEKVVQLVETMQALC